MKNNTIKNESIQVKTDVKAGVMGWNHNEAEAATITVKSGVKAGGMAMNHNESEARSIKVKSGVRAGGRSIGNHNEAEDKGFPEWPANDRIKDFQHYATP